MIKYHTTFRQNSEIIQYSDIGAKHIAVVGGGMSAEREVSLSSSRIVIKALIRLGYKVTFIDMGVDIADSLTTVKPDIVFNCLHGTYGEDGCLPGLLNILRIPYTHSGVLASATAFNKIKAKELFIANGVFTAKHVVVNRPDRIIIDPMPRPYVIKPMNQGSSIGIELVFPEDNFNFAHYDFPYGDTVIVEEYIKGREIQVAVLNGKAIGTLELKLLKSRFHDYDAKYTKGFAEHIIPAKLSKTHYSEVMALAEKANTAIMGTGIVRVEFIFDELQEKFFILEINTHPGLTPTSVYPDIAVSVGVGVDSLIEQILSSARFEQ